MSFERKKKLIPEEVCPGLVQERMSNDNLFDRDQLEGARGYNNFRFVLSNCKRGEPCNQNATIVSQKG